MLLLVASFFFFFFVLAMPSASSSPVWAHSQEHGSHNNNDSCRDDNVPPSVSITLPADGYVLAGALKRTAVIDVAGVANDDGDDGCGVKKVKVQVQDSKTGRVVKPFRTAEPGQDGWSSWEYDFKVRHEGEYRITAQATDRAGNSSVDSVVLRVKSGAADSTPPEVAITAPLNGTVFLRQSAPETTFFVNGTAFDASGIGRVEVSLKNATTPATIIFDYQLATPKAPGDWSEWSYVMTIERIGDCVISARAFDSVGLEAETLIAVSDIRQTTIDILPGASIRGNPAFKPAFLIVGAGDTVTWTNRDSTSHIVTSGDPRIAEPDMVFKSGLISPGEVFSATINNPGNYQYFCAIHPYMTGEVVVE